jgi:hypothetical protein
LDIPSLNSVAVRALGSLFDERQRLFSRRATRSGTGYQLDRTSRKHTMIALMGLNRLKRCGAAHAFDTESIQDAVYNDRSWVKGTGDLGLLTWFTAVCVPERLPSLLDEFDFEGALAHSKSAGQTSTVSLACFLAGISHGKLARPEAFNGLEDVAVDAYRLLQDNQGDEGIFASAAQQRLTRSACNLGTFQDQIWAIYGLSMFGHAFQVDEPLQSALSCANSVCSLQGELGQWWFMYDKRTCTVAKRYPVLSLHQDGTAPCGLLALEEATGRSFRKFAAKGLSWTAGANELGSDLRNADGTFIWDSIGTKGRIRRCWDAAINCLVPSREHAASPLGIRYEARADHFGWLLYAFGSLGLPDPASSAQKNRNSGAIAKNGLNSWVLSS